MYSEWARWIVGGVLMAMVIVAGIAAIKMTNDLLKGSDYDN